MNTEQTSKNVFMYKENQPGRVKKSLKLCGMDSYPNRYVLLNVLGTVTVKSCESDRSGSVLQRLNTYLRA